MPVVTKVRKPTKRKVKKRSEDEFVWPGDTGVKINLYGKSATGKTTLWATFPKPILALIASGSYQPGELKSIDTPENRKVIFPKTIDSTATFIKLLQEQKETEKYATLVLDHASGFQDLVVKEVAGFEEMQVAYFRAASRGQSWGTVSQSQWGTIGNQIKSYFRDLLSLNCHVVIVAQEREFNTDSESSLVMPYVASALIPSVVGWLNPACDYICQTFIRQRTEEKEVLIGRTTVKKQRKLKGVEYCLRTAPDSVFTTKFRLPKGTELPDVIVDPSYEKIKKLIDQGG